MFCKTTTFHTTSKKSCHFVFTYATVFILSTSTLNKSQNCKKLVGFRFIPHAGFSYWPREHLEAHVGLMLAFCSNFFSFSPVLPFFVNTINSLPPLKHFLYVLITLFFPLVATYTNSCKNIVDILVSEWTGFHFHFPLQTCEEVAEKILFSAFTCYLLKVSGFGISGE